MPLSVCSHTFAILAFNKKTNNRIALVIRLGLTHPHL